MRTFFKTRSLHVVHNTSMLRSALRVMHEARPLGAIQGPGLVVLVGLLLLVVGTNPARHRPEVFREKRQEEPTKGLMPIMLTHAAKANLGQEVDKKNKLERKGLSKPRKVMSSDVFLAYYKSKKPVSRLMCYRVLVLLHFPVATPNQTPSFCNLHLKSS